MQHDGLVQWLRQLVEIHAPIREGYAGGPGDTEGPGWEPQVLDLLEPAHPLLNGHHVLTHGHDEGLRVLQFKHCGRLDHGHHPGEGPTEKELFETHVTIEDQERLPSVDGREQVLSCGAVQRLEERHHHGLELVELLAV